MPALFTFGRVLFAVLFIYSGATKLFGIQQTADFIASKVTIPALLTPYTSQIETLAGMPMPQLLAMSIGGFEVLAGLMIALCRLRFRRPRCSFLCNRRNPRAGER